MYFALKLIPPRPTFAQDMTDEERAVMGAHLQYWNGLMEKGTAIVFGPVLDPAGIYGFGIISVDAETEVAEITKNDPASAINRYESYPMMAVVASEMKAHSLN
jgi:uncharacterized protein